MFALFRLSITSTLVSHVMFLPGIDDCKIDIYALTRKREIEEPFDWLLCGKNGSCVDGLDTFVCQCDPGFDGVPCTKINSECLNVFAAEPHTRKYIHVNTSGMYHRESVLFWYLINILHVGPPCADGCILYISTHVVFLIHYR